MNDEPSGTDGLFCAFAGDLRPGTNGSLRGLWEPDLPLVEKVGCLLTQARLLFQLVCSCIPQRLLDLLCEDKLEGINSVFVIGINI